MQVSEATKLRILYFLVFSCTASWLPIFAEYLKSRGLNGIEIGVILSIAPVMMFIVQPVYGMVADKLGFKTCLIWSSVLASLSFLLYLLDLGFNRILFATIFMSLFYNSIQPLLDSISLSLVQKNPNFSYGTLRIAGAAGWAITGTLVGHNIDYINIDVIFIFSAASMFLAFLFAFSIQNDIPSATGKADRQVGQVKDVFANRELIIFLVCVFLISMGGTTVWNFYSIYMKENGASATLVGYGISFQGLCELPFFYFSARIIAKFGKRTTLIITVFALALRMTLYGIVDNPKAALLIELLHGLSWSLFWVVCVEHVNSLVKIEWRATGQSILYASYFGVGAIAGNFWTGFLYDAQLKIATIFLLNAVVVTVVGILMMVFFSKKVQSGSIMS